MPQSFIGLVLSMYYDAMLGWTIGIIAFVYPEAAWMGLDEESLANSAPGQLHPLQYDIFPSLRERPPR